MRRPGPCGHCDNCRRRPREPRATGSRPCRRRPAADATTRAASGADRAQRRRPHRGPLPLRQEPRGPDALRIAIGQDDRNCASTGSARFGLLAQLKQTEVVDLIDGLLRPAAWSNRRWTAFARGATDGVGQPGDAWQGGLGSALPIPHELFVKLSRPTLRGRGARRPAPHRAGGRRCAGYAPPRESPWTRVLLLACRWTRGPPTMRTWCPACPAVLGPLPRTLLDKPAVAPGRKNCWTSQQWHPGRRRAGPSADASSLLLDLAAVDGRLFGPGMCRHPRHSAGDRVGSCVAPAESGQPVQAAWCLSDELLAALEKLVVPGQTPSIRAIGAVAARHTL